MFARTERLMLRPGWPEDAEALHQAMAHREVIANLARAPWPYTLADAHDWLARRSTETVDDVFRLVIAHDGDGPPRLIGGIGLHPPSGVLPDQEAYELGYWLTPSAWGRGYMTEAAGAMIRYAREGLRMTRLSATHFPDNLRSGRVMRKLGFQPTGHIVSIHSLARNGSVECAQYELDMCDTSGARLAA